jgi:hypothetical protein
LRCNTCGYDGCKEGDSYCSNCGAPLTSSSVLGKDNNNSKDTKGNKGCSIASFIFMAIIIFVIFKACSGPSSTPEEAEVLKKYSPTPSINITKIITPTITQSSPQITAISPKTISTPSDISQVAQEELSTEIIECNFEWTFKNQEWIWQIYIPKALYDAYKDLPRPYTKNYSVYVTNPFDDDIINFLAESIQEKAVEEGYSDYDTVSFAVSFVQSLEYTSDEVTKGFDEYPRFPIETIVDKGGDCEDTAILSAAIIDALGYGVVLMHFDNVDNVSGHMAIGVAGGKGVYGSYWLFRERKYYYVETTGENWGIGQIPDVYAGKSAYIYPMDPVPILSHEWAISTEGNYLVLKVTATNYGSAKAEGVYIYAGFDAGIDKAWNPELSPTFDLDIGESKIATLYLVPPYNKYTRLVVQIIYGGFAVEESYSKWIST